MRSFVRRNRVWLTAVTVAIIAIILYWPSLRLPVIYDSLLHIRISDDLTLGTVWLPTRKFGFYRPLTFLPLILIRESLGSYPNWLLHGMNVAQHGLNAALLVLLAWRLWHRWLRAAVIGLLFALFPFSYQAIAVYGHNVHPFVTGLILLGLLTYLQAISKTEETTCVARTTIDENGAQASRLQSHGLGERDVRAPIHTGEKRASLWWGATAVLFILALLSHESAVLFGAFAALIHWNTNPASPSGITFHVSRFTHHVSRLIRHNPWLIFLLAGAAYAIAYRFLPISAGPQGVESSGGSLWLRILYLLQAAAYPFTWFAHRLPNLAAQPLILGSTAVTLFITLWTARRRQHWRPLLLGWGWWGLAAALIAIPLPAGYLLRGPRLLYLGSVGLAFAWGTIVTGDRKQRAADGGKSSIVNPQSLIFGLFCTFILITNGEFVRQKLADYAELTHPVDVVREVMAERPSSEGVILVNLPQWLSPPRNTYALGGEFVAMLGNYLFAVELIRENVGPYAIYPVVITDLLNDPAYHYGLHNEASFRGEEAAALPIASDWQAGGSQLFIIRYPETGIQVEHSGGFVPAHSAARLAAFGPYELREATAVLCKGRVQTGLVWRQTGPIPSTASIFVQLLAEDGRLLAQADGPPLGLRPDLLAIAPNWEINDRRTLTPTEPGRPSQLLIGVYDFTTGERTAAFDRQQTPLLDNAFRLPLTTCQP